MNQVEFAIIGFLFVYLKKTISKFKKNWIERGPRFAVETLNDFCLVYYDSITFGFSRSSSLVPNAASKKHFRRLFPARRSFYFFPFAVFVSWTWTVLLSGCVSMEGKLLWKFLYGNNFLRELKYCWMKSDFLHSWNSNGSDYRIRKNSNEKCCENLILNRKFPNG